MDNHRCDIASACCMLGSIVHVEAHDCVSNVYLSICNYFDRTKCSDCTAYTSARTGTRGESGERKVEPLTFDPREQPEPQPPFELHHTPGTMPRAIHARVWARPAFSALTDLQQVNRSSASAAKRYPSMRQNGSHFSVISVMSTYFCGTGGSMSSLRGIIKIGGGGKYTPFAPLHYYLLA